MNAPPSTPHQWIIRNLIIALALRERELNPPWAVIPGIGVRVSDISRPEPDVMIVPRLGAGLDPSKRDTTEATVLFEIASPSTSKRDFQWKRAAYTSMPKLTHYVVIAQDAAEVVVFARDTGFTEQRLRGLDAKLDFPPLGVSLSHAEVYRDTGLA